MVGEELFQYTGKLLDESTGLYYEGARYYDPTTGRFITEDSYNGTLTDPLSQNRYLYAEDNPMRYVDPTGHVIVAVGSGGGATTQPEDFMTWLANSGFFNDPVHQTQLAFVVVDAAALTLQASDIELFRDGIANAAIRVLFSGGKLSYSAQQLVGDIYNNNLPGVLAAGYGVAGNAIHIFVNGLTIWDRLAFVAAVGLNWGGDVITEGDLDFAGNALTGSALALDAGILAYEMASAYDQYLSSYSS